MTGPRPISTEYKSIRDEELCALACTQLPYRTRAYEELMRRHQGLLFGVCLRLVGNRQDAEDVTQDVMLKILMSLKSFEQRSSFKTWAVSIASNACRDWLRKTITARRYNKALADEPAEQSTIEFQENRLLGLLQTMSSTDREILTLRFVADLSLQEISEISALSLSATKMRLYRAIERMQKKVRSVYGDEEFSGE